MDESCDFHVAEEALIKRFLSELGGDRNLRVTNLEDPNNCSLHQLAVTNGENGSNTGGTDLKGIER